MTPAVWEKIYALLRVDLRLTIERQAIGIFGDQHLGDRRLDWQATLDQTSRCGSPKHHVLLETTWRRRPPGRCGVGLVSKQ
jgi:hypothetical protein